MLADMVRADSHQLRLFYHLRVHRLRKGEPKGLTWQEYRDLIIAAHCSLSAPGLR
jgi:hypothetical protein